MTVWFLMAWILSPTFPEKISWHEFSIKHLWRKIIDFSSQPSRGPPSNMFLDTTTVCQYKSSVTESFKKQNKNINFVH